MNHTSSGTWQCSVIAASIGDMVYITANDDEVHEDRLDSSAILII